MACHGLSEHLMLSQSVTCHKNLIIKRSEELNHIYNDIPYDKTYYNTDQDVPGGHAGAFGLYNQLIIIISCFI